MHAWFGQARWLPKNQHLISMIGKAWRGKGVKWEKNTFTYHCWLIGVNSTFPYESSKWACDLISIKSNDRYISENHHIISFTTSPGVVASAIIDLPMVLAKLRVGLQYVVRIPFHTHVCHVLNQSPFSIDFWVSHRRRLRDTRVPFRTSMLHFSRWKHSTTCIVIPRWQIVGAHPMLKEQPFPITIPWQRKSYYNTANSPIKLKND